MNPFQKHWNTLSMTHALRNLQPNMVRNPQLTERFRLRALNYRNLYNKQSGFFQPKRSAAWLESFDPKEVNFNYTEANGWQYNFFVPHDVNGHMDLLGGASGYAAVGGYVHVR